MSFGNPLGIDLSCITTAQSQLPNPSTVCVTYDPFDQNIFYKKIHLKTNGHVKVSDLSNKSDLIMDKLSKS